MGITTVASTTPESFGLPSSDLMAKISVCSSPFFKKHMARQGNSPPGMCPGCHVDVYHGHPRAPVTPFPTPLMSFYLAKNFWRVAACERAIPPLPSAQIHGEDAEASGHEPRPRKGTRTRTRVLKPSLRERGVPRMSLVRAETDTDR